MNLRFTGPPLDPVAGDVEHPRRAAVAVIGGGIIGTSTALELAERGVDVALFEKGLIAGEQSSRNWGWCRQMGRDPREIPLVRESLAIWRKTNARVNAETGFSQCGILYLAATRAELEGHQRWHDENVRAHQLSTRLVTPEEIGRLLPSNRGQWLGGLYTPDDCRAEPQKAAPAIARAVQARGGKVFTGCAVRGIERAGGRVSGVVTERGRVACDTVVLAGGAWSRRFLHNAGVDFPQLTVINSVMRTEPMDGPGTTALGQGFSFRKRADGGYTVTHDSYSIADIVPDSFRLFGAFLPALRMEWAGLKLRLGQRFMDEARLKRTWPLDESSPFEEVRVLDPAPSLVALDSAARTLKTHFPVFDGMKIAQRWAGCIDVTPDAVPVISPVDGVPGLFLASGFSGHGFGIGPGAGRLMADLVTGAKPVADPRPFRYSRYFDGSNPRPAAGL